MSKIRLSFGSLNYTGMIVAAVAGFGLAFSAGAKGAMLNGETGMDKILTAGLTAGAAGAVTGIWGVFTQRTDPDGKASAFPSLTSTDSAAALYPYDHDNPPDGVTSPTVPAVPIVPIVATGDADTDALINAAANIATKKQAEQARAAALAIARTEVARLEALATSK